MNCLNLGRVNRESLSVSELLTNACQTFMFTTGVPMGPFLTHSLWIIFPNSGQLFPPQRSHLVKTL